MSACPDMAQRHIGHLQVDQSSFSATALLLRRAWHHLAGEASRPVLRSRKLYFAVDCTAQLLSHMCPRSSECTQ